MENDLIEYPWYACIYQKLFLRAPRLRYFLKGLGRHLIIYLPPGFAIYILYSIAFDEPEILVHNKNLESVAIAIASAFLTGGVLTYLFVGLRFFDFFKRQLVSLLYGDDFLKSRKDIDKLWEKVTNAYSNQKFNEISSDLQRTIKETYFPKDHSYYNKEFDIEVVLDCEDKESNLLKSTEIFRQHIVADNTNEIEVSHGTGIMYDSTKNDILDKVVIKSLTVDDEEKINGPISIDSKQVDMYVNDEKTNVTLVEKKTDRIFGYNLTLKLSGKKEYILQRKIEKVYDLSLNPLKSISTKNITSKMNLSIIKPEHLHIEFTEHGNTSEFVDLGVVNGKVRMRKYYDGIILPKQGFTLGIAKRT